MCLKLLANIHCTFFLNETLDILGINLIRFPLAVTLQLILFLYLFIQYEASHRFVGLAYRKDRRQGESMNTSKSYCPKCYLLTLCTLYSFIKRETKY